MNEQVECHSGSAYGQRPLAVHWQGSRLEVETVENEWRSPGKKCFQVRVRDGRRFELIYSQNEDRWTVKEI